MRKLRGARTGTGVVAAIAAALLCAGASAQSLPAAVSAAVERSPTLFELQSNESAARFGQDAANGLSAPRIGVNATAQLTTDFDRKNDSWSATVTGSQTIIDGGYAQSERKRTGFEVQSAHLRLADQKELVALQAVQTYLEVQRSRALVRIFAANKKRLAALQRKVAARVQAGIAGEVELYDAAAKLDAGALNLLDAEAQLGDAIVNFKTLIGTTPGNLTTESAPHAKLPKSETEAVALSIRRSPRIMAVQYDALAADAAASGIAAGQKPKIDLNLSAGHNGEFTDGTTDSNDITAQISFRMDLFDGGVTKARESQARHQADAARHRARATARDIEREMRLSWNIIHLADDRRRILRSQLKNSRESLRLSLARYDAGITSLDQLLDLNTQAAASEAAWLNAEFSHRYNIYRVLAGTGRLMQALHPHLQTVANTP